MVNSFIEGLLAGFGIAIPFGPISVLIVETSIRRGFPCGLAAGLGAASADFVYAVVSAIAGSLVATAIAPISGAVRLISALFLLGLGFWGLRKMVLPSANRAPKATSRLGPFRTYLTVLILTLLNPITIGYFSALILRRNPSDTFSSIELALFVVGAGVASFTWQSLLATVGYALEKVLTPSFQRGATLVGNLVIIGFGISTLFTLF